MYINARGKRHTYMQRQNQKVCFIRDLKKAKRAIGRSYVFKMFQKRPNTIVHLKIDAAMESRRSYKGARSR